MNLWGNISKKVYIDVGSHRIIYNCCLKSNPSNLVISVEPSYLNLAKMMSNLKLNSLVRNHVKILAAASDITGVKKFIFHQTIHSCLKEVKLQKMVKNTGS